MPDDYRCSLASEDDDEPIAGTAPTETDWLFVEQPGAWAAKATKHLAHLVGPHGRAQLIRRYGGSTTPGVRVFRATIGEAPTVTTGLLDDARDLDALTPADYTPYDAPLWLVCTNGRRDVCCAERGRPVAAALAERWPEATWETTHLGGHRFAATLLALPTGVALGRLDPASAVAACAELEQGRLPLDVVRGRAGRPPVVQAADLHLRAPHGWTGLDDVVPLGVDGDTVTLRTPDGVRAVAMESVAGSPRRQSCGDDAAKVKAATSWRLAAPSMGRPAR